VLDLILRRRRDERLSEEVQAHLDMLTDEGVAAGMSQADARRAARRRFGVVDNVTADYREQRGLPLVDGLWEDARFGVRLLRRNPAFAATAALVLALGIGVNNMLFTILYAHTLRGLPIPAAERVMYLTTVDERSRDGGISFVELDEFRQATQGFAGVTAFKDGPIVIAGDDRAPDRVDASYASGNAFAVLGLRPLLGRGLEPADDQSGRPAVAVLGRGLWMSRYGGDSGVLGRTIQAGDAPATIVGVVPDRSGFPSTAAVWLPLTHAPGPSTQRRDLRTLRAVGRLRDGVSRFTAAAEVDAFFSRLSAEHPDTNRNVRGRAVPINEQYFGRVTDPVWIAFITVGFLILLISAANVANLMLGRSVERTREMAIRTSLGATRGRVFRQLLMEGVVLAGLGGLAGSGVAVTGVRLFRSAMPENALPYWYDYSMDMRIVAALVGVTVLTVLIFALLPAIPSSRPDVNQVLKTGGRGMPGARSTRRWTTMFLASEFALAVVFLAQLSVPLRTPRPTLASDAVVETTAVVTGVISLPAATYGQPSQRAAFHRKLSERLRSVAAIASVSVASTPPFSGALEQRLQIGDGGAAADAVGAPVVSTVAVGPRYFETLRLTMVRGREFLPEDASGGGSAVIINERFAHRFFADRDPLGRRIALSAPDGAPAAPRWLTIVGMAPDVRQRPTGEPDAVAYLSYDSAPSPSATLLVRGNDTAERLTSTMREQVQALDASLPVYRVRTMRGVVQDSAWVGRVSARLILSLTWIAIGLCVIGLYAVATHGVTRQTREIGVRMALGASSRAVVWMVVRTALGQVAIGFVAGVGCTVLWDRAFSTGNPAVRPTDPQSLVIVAMILVVLASIGCAVPARRAAHLDPLVAIRDE
jgi:predicted permease